MCRLPARNPANVTHAKSVVAGGSVYRQFMTTGSSGAHEPFSVLMAFFLKANPEHLLRALLSIGPEQTLPPDEIVLVQDGPATAAHDAVVQRFVDSTTIPLRRVVLATNQGLGPALNAGLAACTHDVVARMDADDIAMPERFAHQMPLITGGADLVGAGLIEFGAEADDVRGIRTPLTNPDRIITDARFHQTFNHPTVVYRKSAVLAAGGYQDLASLEDYLLFSAMILNGVAVANLAEPLVRYRVGEGAYARRGGWSILASELQLQSRFRRMGFTTRTQWARNVAVRGGYRLIPENVRRTIYRRVLARKGDRVNTAHPRLEASPHDPN